MALYVAAAPWATQIKEKIMSGLQTTVTPGRTDAINYITALQATGYSDHKS